MVLYNDKLAKLLLWSDYQAITIGPIVFTTKKKAELNETTLNHERIHIAQWVEFTLLAGIVLLIIIGTTDASPWLLLPSVASYYLWYGVEYVWRRLVGNEKQNEDYRRVSFEREAYANQSDQGYTKRRKPFSFIAYL